MTPWRRVALHWVRAWARTQQPAHPNGSCNPLKQAHRLRQRRLLNRAPAQHTAGRHQPSWQRRPGGHRDRLVGWQRQQAEDRRLRYRIASESSDGGRPLTRRRKSSSSAVAVRLDRARSDTSRREASLREVQGCIRGPRREREREYVEGRRARSCMASVHSTSQEVARDQCAYSTLHCTVQ